MVYAGNTLSCIISSSTTQRPGDFYGVFSTYKQHLRPKTRYCQEAHPLNPSHHDWVNMLTWLQVISMEQHGGAVTGITSALSTKPLQIVLRQRRRALHHLWRPGSIPNKWADVCGFLKPSDSDRYWKVRRHGAFSKPRKTLSLRPTDQSCHHETWLHLEFVDWRSTPNTS